jgi:hypothetical protein
MNQENQKHTTRQQSLSQKVVVLDFDETLGHFVELGILCDAISKYYYNHDAPYLVFNDLMDLYPEFLRPNIIRILDYIQRKKQSGECKKVYIYTNNQGPTEWVHYIKEYLVHCMHREYPNNRKKTDTPLFDDTIGAFKRNGRIIEPRRTSEEKTLDDFINYTKLPADVEIFFLEDVVHNGMTADNVYYVRLKPYRYFIPYKDLIERITQSTVYSRLNNLLCHGANGGKKYEIDEPHFKSIMHKFVIELADLQGYRPTYKSVKEHEIDIITSKGIVGHLRRFFKEPLGSNSHSHSHSSHNSHSHSHNSHNIHNNRHNNHHNSLHPTTKPNKHKTVKNE